MSSDLFDTIQRACEALPEAVQFTFNLPGPPYVLLCTKIAREGIDLHLWRRRVVQYHLEWNPTLMEQQIGRVDRVGGLSRRASLPVDVVWAWVPGTMRSTWLAEYEARRTWAIPVGLRAITSRLS